MTATKRLNEYLKKFTHADHSKIQWMTRKGNYSSGFYIISKDYPQGRLIGNSETEAKLCLAEAFGDEIFLKNFYKGHKEFLKKLREM